MIECRRGKPPDFCVCRVFIIGCLKAHGQLSETERLLQPRNS
jgi:hypothetical protein